MKLSTFSVISRVQIQLKLRSSYLFAERFYFAHGLPFDLQELVEEEPADFMKGDCIKKKMLNLLPIQKPHSAQ